jgi:hypothetical protein
VCVSCGSAYGHRDWAPMRRVIVRLAATLRGPGRVAPDMTAGPQRRVRPQVGPFARSVWASGGDGQ